MDKLKVDTNDLRQAASDLDRIYTEFEDANSNSDALADACGDGDLAGHIKDFAHNWSVHRDGFMDSIDALRKSLRQGADALEQTDEKLAAGLSPQAPAPTTTGGDRAKAN